jgi:hypothetical protein
MLDLLPWVFVVQLWTDPPPKIKFVYKKEFPTYEVCMQAREEWIKQNKPPNDYVILCMLKAND